MWSSGITSGSLPFTSQPLALVWVRSHVIKPRCNVCTRTIKHARKFTVEQHGKIEGHKDAVASWRNKSASLLKVVVHGRIFHGNEEFRQLHLICKVGQDEASVSYLNASFSAKSLAYTYIWATHLLWGRTIVFTVEINIRNVQRCLRTCDNIVRKKIGESTFNDEAQASLRAPVRDGMGRLAW